MKRGRAGATPGNPLMTVKDNTSGIVLVQGTAAAVTPAEAGRIVGKAFRRFGAPQQLHVDFGREFVSEKFMRVVNSAEVMLYVGSSPRPLLSKRN
jgi:hypothetical protein